MLTDEHRARIVEALPPGAAMTQEAWNDLLMYVIGYGRMATRRARYPIVKERARWARIRKAVDVVEAELNQLRREPQWPHAESWLVERLQPLWEIQHRADIMFAWHETWEAFGGRRDPNREFLYWGVLRIWTDQLGGKVRYSMSPAGPGGPLVRFFTACVEPILQERAPGAGVRGIIDREREARNAVEAAKWRRRRIAL